MVPKNNHLVPTREEVPESCLGEIAKVISVIEVPTEVVASALNYVTAPLRRYIKIARRRMVRLWQDTGLNFNPCATARVLMERMTGIEPVS